MYLHKNQLSALTESIGNLSSLTLLKVQNNQLTSLPDSIGDLSRLEMLDLTNNQLVFLPDSIGSLSSLRRLDLNNNHLTFLPKSMASLSRLEIINLTNNHLNILPENIGDFSKLAHIYLGGNQLDNLPKSIGNLPELILLNLNGNSLKDLQVLKKSPKLQRINFLNVELTSRYWIKSSEWKSEWLLDEDNVEIRRILVERLGYQKICEELNAITIDTWREYDLLAIDGVEKVHTEYGEPIGTEPMVLLKMTCPSTQHIHILRVPPEMTSAEAAITWVNHGIHPDEFAVQT